MHRSKVSRLENQSPMRSDRKLLVVIAVLVIVIISIVSVTELVSSPTKINPGGPPPFNNPRYLVAPDNSCLGPCFGGNLSIAVVFDCAAAAATSSGCHTTVKSPSVHQYAYNITIWYPRTNQSTPIWNCEYQPDNGAYTTPLPAWCSARGSNTFVISEPPLPPE